VVRRRRVRDVAWDAEARAVQCPSLKEYVLVAQDDGRIEVCRRGEGPWSCETAGPGGKVKVHGRTVKVDDVYG
jgi:hypothetical protein